MGSFEFIGFSYQVRTLMKLVVRAFVSRLRVQTSDAVSNVHSAGATNIPPCISDGIAPSKEGYASSDLEFVQDHPNRLNFCMAQTITCPGQLST